VTWSSTIRIVLLSAHELIIGENILATCSFTSNRTLVSCCTAVIEAHCSKAHSLLGHQINVCNSITNSSTFSTLHSSDVTYSARGSSEAASLGRREPVVSIRFDSISIQKVDKPQGLFSSSTSAQWQGQSLIVRSANPRDTVR